MSQPDLAAIPNFLRRSPEGKTMTQTPPASPAKKPKQKRHDAYIANVKVTVPLDMSNADSLANAIKAVAAIKDGMPAGATVETSASLGKV